MRIQAKRLELDIPVGTPLTGWARATRLCNKIDEALEANILVLSSQETHVILIVLDTLFGARWLEQQLEETLTSVSNGKLVHIITVGTHTHFAPGLDRNKPMVGAIDLQWQAKLADKLTETLSTMLIDTPPSQPCKIEVTTGQIPLSVSRRKPWRWPLLSRRSVLRFPSIVIAPNYDEPIDQSAAIATIRNSAGHPVCVIANWAAHPTIFPERNTASSEYIGMVRAGIREKVGFDLPILFLQGFAGDVRPIPPSNSVSLMALLMYGPQFTAFDMNTWRQFSQTLTGYFLGMLDTKTTPEQAFTAPTFSQSAVQLAELIDGNNGTRQILFRHVAISKSLTFVFVPAEPSSAYSSLVHDVFPGAWPTGYSGDVFGYWPTDKQVREGGYEAKGFFPLFGLNGKFFGRNETVFKDMLRKLKTIL